VDEFSNQFIYPMVTKTQAGKGENSMWNWLETTLVNHVWSPDQGLPKLMKDVVKFESGNENEAE